MSDTLSEAGAGRVLWIIMNWMCVAGDGRKHPEFLLAQRACLSLKNAPRYEILKIQLRSNCHSSFLMDTYLGN